MCVMWFINKVYKTTMLARVSAELSICCIILVSAPLNVFSLSCFLSFCFYHFSFCSFSLSEHHAHLGSHVPQWAHEPSPSVPSQAGCTDADPGYLESYAQSLPQPRGGKSEWAVGLDAGVYWTSHHDGSAHPRGEQVLKLRICFVKFGKIHHYNIMHFYRIMIISHLC